MIGEILDGKYRIDNQLGAGGMGNVYLATHLGTTRVVAVKVIAPKWAADPHFLGRFQREAQACGRLRHPNIVNVTDFGIAKAGNADLPYLVMELLDGDTLAAFQKTNPRPALTLVADLLDQIGLALEEAHRHGIVHRDLKPDNIWVEPDGRGGYSVKVLDFGVAKVTWMAALPPPMHLDGRIRSGSTISSDQIETGVIEAPATVEVRKQEAETVALAASASSGSAFGSSWSDAGGQTMPGSLVGTPAYMSPEQALGQETDFRSDIYSLALVAYSLVCGQLPFTGKGIESLQQQQAGNPPAPSSVCKTPPDVSDAILVGMARNPADRPASAVAFTRRFHNAVDAEFLALRRSRAFLMQHIGTFIMLVLPIYSIVVALTAILSAVGGKLLSSPAMRMAFVPLAAAVLFVFSDNMLRAATALVALDEQVRIRRFMSFRVFWKLLKSIPVLLTTQVRALFFYGPGWIVGDCLWPVVCMVEKLSGEAALHRSRELMTGLRSAGRALAIRHLALAVFAVSDLIQSFASAWRTGVLHQPDVVVKSTWFPVFAVFAAAPLFLYDRTAARETGPLLRLDRTPEVPITSRRLSVSSIVWLTAGLIYLLYQPLELWIFGR
ncbi:MAG TPA: serine/threonine-protein kinase [Bryobacteraceae bacterium]|jgi:serine/threonine protein kinase